MSSFTISSADRVKASCNNGRGLDEIRCLVNLDRCCTDCDGSIDVNVHSDGRWYDKHFGSRTARSARPVHSFTEEITYPSRTDGHGSAHPEVRRGHVTEYDLNGRILRTRGRSCDGANGRANLA